jgi:tRNA (guanine-N7-)-methyltransferase
MGAPALTGGDLQHAEAHAMSADALERLPRRVRSFVLRQGRMSPAQRRACDELLPRYALPDEGVYDWQSVFGRKAPVVLEIGFGMGETTAAIASAQPDVDFLGVEMHMPGVGALLRRVEAGGLTNVRVVRADVVDVIARIADGSLAGIHVYFPDPWPKKRHHKRRLLQSEFVHVISAKLARGGYLHVATDWQPYADEILAVFEAEPLLAKTCDGFAPRPAWRPVTKFERRGVDRGHPVFDLLFTRR